MICYQPTPEQLTAWGYRIANRRGTRATYWHYKEKKGPYQGYSIGLMPYGRINLIWDITKRAQLALDNEAELLAELKARGYPIDSAEQPITSLEELDERIQTKLSEMARTAWPGFDPEAKGATVSYTEIMGAEKLVRGQRFKKLPNGNIQVYAKQRSRHLAAIGIKHSAWRLVIELTPGLINELHQFSQDK